MLYWLKLFHFKQAFKKAVKLGKLKTKPRKYFQYCLNIIRMICYWRKYLKKIKTISALIKKCRKHFCFIFLCSFLKRNFRLKKWQADKAILCFKVEQFFSEVEHIVYSKSHSERLTKNKTEKHYSFSTLEIWIERKI